MSLLLNMLSVLLITFLPRSKRLLISWLQSPSAEISIIITHTVVYIKLHNCTLLQPWDFFGRNDAKAETPVLWPPHRKS